MESGVEVEGSAASAPLRLCRKCGAVRRVGDKRCVECKRASNAAWRAANPAYRAAWRAANLEKNRAYTAAWRAANPAYARTPHSRFLNLRRVAKRRGLVFSLTEEAYAPFVSRPCTYCGGSLNGMGGGLDRKDNGRGYELDNVVPCCPACNTERGCLAFHEFKSVIAGRRRRWRQAEREANADPN